MKRLTFTFLIAASVLVSNAQTQKGRIFLGGSIYYWGSSNDRLDTTGKASSEDRTTEINLNLRGGYFVADNLAVGIIVGFNSLGDKRTNYFVPPSKDVTTDKTNVTRYGIFGRYYNMIGDSKLAIFGQLDVTLGSGKNKHEISSVNTTTTTVTKTTYDVNEFNVSLAPGLAYFLTDHFALEATFGNLGYMTDNRKYYNSNGRLGYQTKASTLNVSLRPSTLQLGLSFYFGGGGKGDTK